MSISNPFNFGPRIGSIDSSPAKPEFSGKIIVIRRSRWKYKYGIGSSNPLDPATKEYYDEYIDVGEPDGPWEPIGGGGATGGGGGASDSPFPGGIIAGYGVGNPIGPIRIDLTKHKNLPSWAIPVTKIPRWADDYIFIEPDGRQITVLGLNKDEKKHIESIVDKLILDPDILNALSLFNFYDPSNPQINNCSNYLFNLLYNRVYIGRNIGEKQHIRTVKMPMGSSQEGDGDKNRADIVVLLPDNSMISNEQTDLVTMVTLVYAAVKADSDYPFDAIAIALLLIEIMMQSGRYVESEYLSSLITNLEDELDAMISGQSLANHRLDSSGNKYYETQYFRWYPESGKLFIKNGMIEIELKGDWKRP